MTNNIYYSILGFEQTIKGLVKEAFGANYEDLHLLLFNKDKTKIVYQFDHTKDCSISTETAEQIYDRSTALNTNGRICYRICETGINIYSETNNKDIRQGAIFISDKPAADFKDYFCVILFCYDDKTASKSLFEDLKPHENYLIQTCFNLFIQTINYESLFRIIDTFIEIVSQKDAYMPNHMSNVSILSIKVADKLNLSKEQKFLLRIASLVHDIGKICMPDQIFYKTDKLDRKERDLIKEHCIRGEDIAGSAFYHLDFLSQIPSFIRSHHENFDGSGYPDGLSGGDIPYLSRIIRVADSVDAMLTNKVYKDAMSISSIMKELAKTSGREFDPDIAKAMIEVLDETSNKKISQVHLNENIYPKATFSFEYLDAQIIHSLCGNLVFNSDHTAMLYVHTSNPVPLSRTFIKDNIYNPTISVFTEDNLYEFNAEISEIVENTFHFVHVQYFPTDKYFSLIWNSTLSIQLPNQNVLISEMINLGADTLVFKLNNDDAKQLIAESNHPIVVRLKESLEDIELNELVHVKIVKFYTNMEETFFTSRYVSISSHQRDKIIKLLFRKQILSRRG